LVQKTGQNNNGKYKEWWYVITNNEDKKEYEKYHQTMTRMEIRGYLRGIVGGKA
jgi:hypothetical protein